MARYDVRNASADKYIFKRTAAAKHKVNSFTNRRRGGFRL